MQIKFSMLKLRLFACQLILLPMVILFSIFFYVTYLSAKCSAATDALSPYQTVRDNGEFLVSAGENFVLGFFSPSNSKNRYIGIWFNIKNVPQQAVVWVANRNDPLNGSSGTLTVTTAGNILIYNESSVPIWSSNSFTTSNNSVLQLLDTGNLVVKDAGSDSVFWQSFDHPFDTLIPGMKLGVNIRTNQKWFLSSWKSLEDPSSGYACELQATGLPQVVVRRGSNISYRSAPWDGVQSGRFKLKDNSIFKNTFVFNSTFVYYSYKDNGISRFILSQSGLLQYLTWSERREEWVPYYTLQRDECDDVYAKCGPNGICNMNKELFCRCPIGFIPKAPQDWDNLDWSGGCTLRTELNCSMVEGFRKISRLKLPDNSHYFLQGTSVSRMECEVNCLRNCSCVAYVHTDANKCIMWFGSLLDMIEYTDGGQELFIRVAASELESEKKLRQRTVIVTASIVSGVLLLAIVSCYHTWKSGHKRKQVHVPNQVSDPISREEDLDLPSFDLLTITTATNNFAFTNKIGEGGFGHVYKGKLPTGQEIAVKRLSKDSQQGLQEFKNEVILIAKLQHRNLVRLLGCCIHGEEKMLIYEYMHNRSLDLYIYNQTSVITLDWHKRFDIIAGIARGLLYLHRDSRLRIIHRDLKASNILLDSDMNPKISDFGLARMFGGDQTEANTTRVVGTYGYMSPEYATDGLFSVKSDVFSFGVLVLEIISGKRNRGFYHFNHDKNLLGHAWKLWNEGKPLELVDAAIEDSVTISEVMRCILVGLLCVQEHPDDRPTMSSVLLMLDSEQPSLPQPKQPGFYTGRFLVESFSSTPLPGEILHRTRNEVTITLLQGR